MHEARYVILNIKYHIVRAGAGAGVSILYIVYYSPGLDAPWWLIRAEFMSEADLVKTRPFSAVSSPTTLTLIRSVSVCMAGLKRIIFLIFQWTKLPHMKKICGFVGGVLVDRPIHFDTDQDI